MPILYSISVESMWNSQKPFHSNGKKHQNGASQDSKAAEAEAYNRLLLSTLGRNHDYAINMFRRFQHRNFSYITPEAMLDELNGGCNGNSNQKTKKKTLSLKRGSVFKVPHLPHPPKNIPGGSAMANGLQKMGEAVKKGFHKQKEESRKMMKKNSTSTLSIRRGNKSVPGSLERHSIAGLEHLTSRMTLGGPIRGGTTSTTPNGTLDLRVGGISRHPSNVSDFIGSVSSFV